MPKMAMLIDLDLCTGCEACTTACKQEKNTPEGVSFARTLNVETGTAQNRDRFYLPVLCYQCEDAPCLKSCPNKAVRRREDGIVVIDEDRCAGTGACVSACPYGNVYLTSVGPTAVNESVAIKCDYCASRVDQGKEPACVTACQSNARIFGDIEDPESKVSKYVDQHQDRAPFFLLPELGTRPAGMYLAPKSGHSQSGAGGSGSKGTAHVRSFAKHKLTLLRLVTTLLMSVSVMSLAYSQDQMNPASMKVYADSSCAGCHGEKGEGGYGPALNTSKMTQDEFLKLVRNGKGDEMPATASDELSDADAQTIYTLFKGTQSTPKSSATPMNAASEKVYKDSSCAGCHGDKGEGGYGPALDTSKMTQDDFLKLVRNGKGDEMPATAPDELSDADALSIYNLFKAGAKSGAPVPMEPKTGSGYTVSSCTGCHGVTGMGGVGPPLSGTKLTEEEFLSIVRSGKGIMPATSASVLSDDAVKSIYNQLKVKEVNQDEVPISFKVGQFLSTQNVSRIFLVIFIVAFILGLWNLSRWLRAAGIRQLRPNVGKFGRFRAWGIVIKALIAEGLGVASLFRKNKARWFMHALMLYGFIGLILADVWMQIVNPERADLPMTTGPQLLSLIAGISVFVGVCYVFYRYKKDEYIDNGVTLGRDFLFVNLLFHTIFSGFLTVAISRSGANEWLMTVYIYHLSSLALLVLTAPFTGFMHAWVAPAMAAVTKLTEAMSEPGLDSPFQQEPSPGRHHKSERMAKAAASAFAPGGAGDVRIDYKP